MVGAISHFGDPCEETIQLMYHPPATFPSKPMPFHSSSRSMCRFVSPPRLTSPQSYLVSAHSALSPLSRPLSFKFSVPLSSHLNSLCDCFVTSIEKWLFWSKPLPAVYFSSFEGHHDVFPPRWASVLPCRCWSSCRC